MAEQRIVRSLRREAEGIIAGRPVKVRIDETAKSRYRVTLTGPDGRAKDTIISGGRTGLCHLDSFRSICRRYCNDLVGKEAATDAQV